MDTAVEFVIVPNNIVLLAYLQVNFHFKEIRTCVKTHYLGTIAGPGTILRSGVVTLVTPNIIKYHVTARLEFEISLVR